MIRNLVSVVIPIYNVEQYLAQCVQSVIQQTYHELEIILVDDGSPDACGRMCDDFARMDHRVKVVHKKNGGLSDARNAGIEMATGNFITFIDSDDYIKPNMIETLVGIALSEKCDIVQCAYIKKSDTNVGEISKGMNSDVKYVVYTEDKMAAYIRDKIIDTIICGKIYKTSLFYGIRFPVGKLHEDIFTTYQLIHNANAIAITDYTGYVYRINPRGIMHSFSMSRLDSITGLIKRAHLIEEKYPTLISEAYADIIYACNQCLMLLGQHNVYDADVMAWMKDLYKKYCRYYIKSPSKSVIGKVVAIIAFMNIRLAWRLFRLLYKITY